jgi:acetyl-CoA synthetase
VEDAVAVIPDIDEAAAIGVPDPVKGQRVVLFIVAAASWDGDQVRLSTIVRDRVEASLGKAFRPAAVHVVAELPKTRSSKVMRRLIRNVYCDQPLGDLSALDNPAALDQIMAAAEGA